MHQPATKETIRKSTAAKKRKPDVDPKKDIDAPDPAPVEEPKKKTRIKEPGKPPPKKK
jgi:hypothetical protein